jgi:hypothetical protein
VWTPDYVRVQHVALATLSMQKMYVGQLQGLGLQFGRENFRCIGVVAPGNKVTAGLVDAGE